MPSVYVDRSAKNPLEAKHQDIFAKMVSVTRKLRKLRSDDVIRMAGCPVSVAEQALALVKLGKLRNPYWDPKQAIPYTNAYLSWRTRQAIARLSGKPYNKPGAYARGAARPEQNRPPEGASLHLEPIRG